jgi:hypothetical protein
MTYLLQSYDNKDGYTFHHGTPPRDKEGLVPWAMTGSNQVVYAPMRARRHIKPFEQPNIRPYNSIESKARRRLCQTELGSIALSRPLFSKGGVAAVSKAVKLFMLAKLSNDRQGTINLFSQRVGKYLYGTSYMSFGRISDVVPTGPAAAQTMWDQSIAALERGDSLPTVLSIHDGAGKSLIAQGDPEKIEYDYWAQMFRASGHGEMFEEVNVSKTDKPQMSSDPSRGRAKLPNPGNIATTTPGIAKPGITGNLPGAQLRNRGVDMYERTAETRNQPPNVKPAPGVLGSKSPNVYFQQLDERNELFGAGPSGTTGTLLAAALTFGNLKDEALKEYMFAIIGYLVGGGMHSLHESLSIMQWLPPEYKMEYNPGSLLAYTPGNGGAGSARADDFPALPKTFTSSNEFTRWREKYYDVVVLGGIHWMYAN